MQVLTSVSTPALWQEVLKTAEYACSVSLEGDLEAYLIGLLIRYTNKPEALKQVLATAFLEALEQRLKARSASLQMVGDQCLLFAGLFPKLADKKHVKLSYFVDLGQSAYAAISQTTNDLYGSLALQFVVLMDVLQSIRSDGVLDPLTAYEQWDELGSQRAFKVLESYTFNGLPLKRS